MDEAEWSTSTDIEALLRHLSGSASESELRRFAVDCARQGLALLKDEVAQSASEWLALAEKRAAGFASVGLVNSLRAKCSEICASLESGPETETPTELAYSAAAECAFTESAMAAALNVSGSVARAFAMAAADKCNDADYDARYLEVFETERVAQAKLLRQRFPKAREKKNG